MVAKAPPRRVAGWGQRLLVSLVALLPAAEAHALDPDRPLSAFTVQVWRARDGLPGDSVRALAQTADGRLWAATLGGVARFDGRRWAPVQTAADPRTALGDVSRLQATADGAVWWSPAHRPPLRWWGGGARTFGPAEGLPAGTEARAWAEDGRHVWMATADGLYRYADGRFVAHALRGLGGASITGLQVDAAGTIWVGTSAGLRALHGADLQPPAVPGSISALLRDRRGTLWVAAGPRLLALPGGTSQDAGAPITALADDLDGNLWIGTGAGLARLHGGQLARFSARDGLPEDDVTAVFVDREDTLWVGTRHGGVAQLTDRTLATLTLPGLSGDLFDSVCEGPDGALWFGTRGRGAVRYRGGQTTVLGTADGLPSGVVHAVLADAGGDVWLGTEGGLVRYRDGRVTDPRVWGRFVTGLYQDRAGALWIQGNGELGRLADGQLTRFDPHDGLPAGQLRAVAEDGRGRLWVSGVGGLVRLENGRFVAPGLTEGRPGGDRRNLGGVRAMLSARDGVFWLTTVGRGLARVSDDTLVMSRTGGATADMLYQLLEDDAGDLWVGAHNKILRLDRASLDAVAAGSRATADSAAFQTTDRRTGVIAARIRQPSAWKARDGRLWFVTDQGPVVIDPHHLRGRAAAPVVEIESISVDGRSAPAGAVARFPAGPGRLLVSYGAVSLLAPHDLRYRRRLAGVDAGWVDTGSGSEAAYPGLRPGSYLFEVQAGNRDGVWSTPARFAFTLAPPWHRSPWFLAASGLALAALAVAAHRLRLARVRAGYVLLFAERNRVARELHDTLFQGMTALSLQLGGMRAQAADAPEGWRRDLDLMQDTLRRCLEEGRQAVWGLRARAGDFAVSVERMVRRRCAEAGVACAIEIEGPVGPLAPAVEDELHRIVQESVTNALRHARPQLVRVRLAGTAHSLALIITDDGAGFDPAAVDAADAGHFGLRGLRERAERIGATLEIRSTRGQGTTVELRLERRR